VKQNQEMSPAIWIAIGIAIGAGIGVALGNIAIGVAIGVGVGAALMAWQTSVQKKNDDSGGPDQQ
jgi:F0F1-type ATP synthase membrane subunit c/vacuolar-type H+-ATPase subunit K